MPLHCFSFYLSMGPSGIVRVTRYLVDNNQTWWSEVRVGEKDVRRLRVQSLTLYTLPSSAPHSLLFTDVRSRRRSDIPFLVGGRSCTLTSTSSAISVNTLLHITYYGWKTCSNHSDIVEAEAPARTEGSMCLLPEGCFPTNAA